MHEPFEIFHFGEKIYRQLAGESPYALVKNFVPSGKCVTLKDKGVTANIVNRMIASDASRAEVFSELLIEINTF